ncbi:serine protease Hayan-like [Zeugodacus cucurbitae]|uniref:serine protease Hayan-like n=1 Tax=Zeugodacus cucurbitae TaxID=28588 RepID=UPI0023D925CE|nr:serine protease Hayan-like [Zeugodacus cucurbitae]
MSNSLVTKPLAIFFIAFSLLATCNQRTNAQAIKRPAVKACEALDNGLQPNSIPRTPEGSAALPGKYPYVALIGHENEKGTIEFRCGGALIDKRFVLTSAACLVHGKPTIVRLGITSLDDVAQSGGMVERKIKAIHVHPEHTVAAAYNDIGLIELDGDVKYSTLVYPVCLHTGAAIPENNTELYATRWGVNCQLAVSAARVQLLSNPLCRNAFSELIKKRTVDDIRSTQLCAHNVNPSADDCSTAVDSFGLRSEVPDVLTRVSEYLDFIEPIVWPSSNEN